MLITTYGTTRPTRIGKRIIAQRRALKAIAEELDLRAVAEPLAVVPEFRADQEEAGRVDQARPGGHLPVDADPR